MAIVHWLIALGRRVLKGRHQNGLSAWFAAYQRGRRRVPWRGTATFSILMPVYKVRPDWLAAAIASVRRQTYPHWELVCIDDHSAEPALSAILRRAARSDRRIRVLVLGHNQGVSRATNAGLAVASGDYILFMDHDDVLEPHALARFGDAACAGNADIIYGDEVVTGEQITDIRAVHARSVFSHTHYLSHPFVVHPLAVRAALARDIGGLDPSLAISQDVDFLLRALERAGAVTHVPDILYRWRTSPGSAGHQLQAAVMATGCAIKTAHLRRIGFPAAEVREGASFNTFDVRYFARPAGRVLCIIDTGEGAQSAARCLHSVQRTTAGLDVDAVIGPASLDTPHDFLLFLDGGIEATGPGWLAAMMDLAMRADVGAVGATLLCPATGTASAGAIVQWTAGGGAPGAFRLDHPPHPPALHTTRDYSALTEACLLVPTELFRAVGGFDAAFGPGLRGVDLTLRLGQAGKRIVCCAQAVLLDHARLSPDSGGTAAFERRHHQILLDGDPHASPVWGHDPATCPRPAAHTGMPLRYRTATGVLPQPPAGAGPGPAGRT